MRNTRLQTIYKILYYWVKFHINPTKTWVQSLSVQHEISLWRA